MVHSGCDVTASGVGPREPTVPLVHVNTPSPCISPWSKSPSYTWPFKNVALPRPW
jgi:hypothetical protein